MTNYAAPIDDLKHLLNDVLNINEILDGSDFDSGLIEAILNEAGKFASEVLNPINYSGNIEGAKISGNEVATPKGFKEAYKAFIENGWNSVPFPSEYGGQGLPWLVSNAISEMWSGANMAFALCPLLTQGSVDLLEHHGSEEQKQKYLTKLISGQWTGTMCLTEPQAGSDVGAITTTAEQSGDHYKIKGQKIYITYGEHDFTENIVHMVLARVKDAPAGVKGISLFIVPKFLDDGSRNDIKAISIEHKLGIHASPTAVMAIGDEGGAKGYLVGEENNGLKYMFTMMNNARLAVGVEGIAIAENSYQQALAYAMERKQFGVNIAEFPDVRRMLLTIKSQTEAMRALALYIAKSIDIYKGGADDEAKASSKKIVDFLIPIIKAHSTDVGLNCASEAVQIFGGIGYVEETKIAQNLRDAKIAQIYEGTNGIQAMDLISRKLDMEGAFEAVYSQMLEFAKGSKFESKLGSAMEKLKEVTEKLRGYEAKERGSVAAYYLEMCGIIFGAAMLGASEKSLNGDGDFVSGKRESIEFYMNKILPKYNYLANII